MQASPHESTLFKRIKKPYLFSGSMFLQINLNVCRLFFVYQLIKELHKWQFQLTYG